MLTSFPIAGQVVRMHALLGCLLLEKLLQSVTRVVQYHLVCLKDLPIAVENADKLRNGIYLLPHPSFVSPDFFFSTLSIFNFNTRSVPLDNLAESVAHRHFAVQEPAILTVSSSHPGFRLEGFP